MEMFYAHVSLQSPPKEEAKVETRKSVRIVVEEKPPETEFFLTLEKTDHKPKDQIQTRVEQHVGRALALFREADGGKNRDLYVQAGKFLDKAIFLRPEDDSLYVMRGQCSAQVGDHMKSLKYHKIAAKINPDNKVRLEVSRLACAQSMSDGGEFGRAREIVADCIARNPENPRPHLLLIEITGLDGTKEEYGGKIDDFVRKFGETEELLEVMLKNTTNDESLFQSERFLRMAHHFNETGSLELRARENHNLAKRFLLSGKPSYALNQIKAAIKLLPANSDIHTTKGAIHEVMDQLGEAAAEYLESYRLSPMGPGEDERAGTHISRLLNRLGVRAMGEGRLEEALGLLNLVSVQRYEFYLNRAQCLQKMGEFEMALEDYHEAQGRGDEVGSRMAGCYFELAESEFGQRRLERAEENYTRAIELEGRREFYWGRSRCRIEMKKFAPGVDDVVEALGMAEYSQEEVEQMKLALLSKYGKGRDGHVCDRLINHHK